MRHKYDGLTNIFNRHVINHLFPYLQLNFIFNFFCMAIDNSVDYL